MLKNYRFVLLLYFLLLNFNALPPPPIKNLSKVVCVCKHIQKIVWTTFKLLIDKYCSALKTIHLQTSDPKIHFHEFYIYNLQGKKTMRDLIKEKYLRLRFSKKKNISIRLTIIEIILFCPKRHFLHKTSLF